MATEEARGLQTIAEVQYKSRRQAQNRLVVEEGGPQHPQHPSVLTIRNTPPPLESIWWDSTLCTSLPTHKPPHEDPRLIMLFLDFIFPIQFGFYPMSNPMDHSWLISGLCSNEARYHAALSVTASFEASLREPEKTDRIGLNLEVTERQAIASSDLQTTIVQFNQHAHTSREMISIGLQVLEVMHQLLSLEIFRTWELRHRAAMTLLNTLHTPLASSADQIASNLSPLEMALRDFSSPETQKTLEFHVTCGIWIDVIANATFGTPSHDPPNFNYIPYLHSNTLKTQSRMGCHSTVMAIIAEITLLSDWRASPSHSQSLVTEELSSRATLIAARLLAKIQELEQRSTLGLTKIEAEGHMVSLQFAYAAQVYLHVVVSGANTINPVLVSYIEQNLQTMEGFPLGLLIRVNWAFTVSGCMSSLISYGRFRDLVGRLRAQKRPLGMTWKGLMIMEECWRLRESRPELEGNCDWKTAMKSLGVRILPV